MAPKNKLIIKRAIAILTPMILIIVVSCFFFIDIRWEEMTYEQLKNSIMTWVLTYGGIIILTAKAFLLAVSIKRTINQKPGDIKDKLKIYKKEHKIETTKEDKSKEDKTKPPKIMGY